MTLCVSSSDNIYSRVNLQLRLCAMISSNNSSFSEASSTTPIWMGELRCLGTESRLIDCPANTIEAEDCSHSEDVALICTVHNIQGNNYSINSVICMAETFSSEFNLFSNWIYILINSDILLFMQVYIGRPVDRYNCSGSSYCYPHRHSFDCLLGS